ncbi:MAG: hypothetical protein VX826_00885 [Candidatus Neomarinimicrobiota bacterium]|jgi:hypothetical protein|nr:hypothetical protein [Candidatus Neomarinimicrobiota bacterium]MEE3139455.1 hypothetical protein [Candidatus Neomarinimicrobiota bacterium]GIT10093.1 MAG: hypothetical protein CM1200mP31_2620 [Candidatus Neomarinimicrobiota bacterium]|tara:strand:- start:426 stop:620 length:195 start_codon:yes stop_codon:yes gene_type:complete
MNKLKVINTTQFYMQLFTASLLLYFTLTSDRPKMAIIPILLLISWTLGYIQRRITRRRVNKLKK